MNGSSTPPRMRRLNRAGSAKKVPLPRSRRKGVGHRGVADEDVLEELRQIRKLLERLPSSPAAGAALRRGPTTV